VQPRWLKKRDYTTASERPPRGGLSEIPIRCIDQVAIAADAFRFLRQPSRPKAPRPVATSGSAPGITCGTFPLGAGYPTLYCRRRGGHIHPPWRACLFWLRGPQVVALSDAFLAPAGASNPNGSKVGALGSPSVRHERDCGLLATDTRRIDLPPRPDSGFIIFIPGKTADRFCGTGSIVPCLRKRRGRRQQILPLASFLASQSLGAPQPDTVCDTLPR
jgi:hypothetical protein